MNAGKSVGGAPFPSASHDPCRSRGQPATMRSHSGSRLPVNSGGASFSSACLRCGLFVGSAVFRSIRLITRSIAAISRSTRRSNQRTPPNAMTSAVSITTLAQPKIWLPIYGFLPCSTPVAALGALLWRGSRLGNYKGTMDHHQPATRTAGVYRARSATMLHSYPRVGLDLASPVTDDQSQLRLRSRCRASSAGSAVIAAQTSHPIGGPGNSGRAAAVPVGCG